MNRMIDEFIFLIGKWRKELQKDIEENDAEYAEEWIIDV